MVRRVVNTQVRFDNSSNISYVVKKFNNGTYQLITYRKIQGCYQLVGKKNGVCVV
jgi:hypothetical protein